MTVFKASTSLDTTIKLFQQDLKKKGLYFIDQQTYSRRNAKK